LIALFLVFIGGILFYIPIYPFHKTKLQNTKPFFWWWFDDEDGVYGAEY
jgi:hypothetical protein